MSYLRHEKIGPSGGRSLSATANVGSGTAAPHTRGYGCPQPGPGQGGGGGGLPRGAGAHGQGRRRSGKGPRAPENGHHQEPGFIGRDQVGAESTEFFLPAPTPADATHGSGDRCALWRAVGAAAG